MGTMQTQTAIERTESRRQGLIVAVSLSGERGVPKHPQSAVRVGQYGLEGDCHAGPRYTNVRTGEEKDNRRHVTIVAQEALDEMNAVLGIALRPGDLAENVLVRGLGDLSDVAAGDRLHLGSQVVLEVTGQNDPCANLLQYHRRLAKNIYGKRGLIARVASTGELRPGDPVELVSASQAGPGL